MLSVYLLGLDVRYYGYFYVFKCITFFSYRLIEYRKTKLHYFMWELCYWVAMSIGVFFVLLDNGYITDPLWFRMIYSIAHGPLVLAAVSLGDKVVVHDLQYMVGAFMHISPAMFTWGLRWKLESLGYYDSTKIDRSVEIRPDLHFIYGMTGYMMWCVPYLIIVFGLLNNRIYQRGYDTLYQYMFRNTKFGIFNFKEDTYFRRFYYIGYHVFSAAATTTLASLWYSNFVLDTTLVLFVGIHAIWKAATYYEHKYQKKSHVAVMATEHFSD